MATYFDMAQERKRAEAVDQAIDQIRNAAMVIRAAATTIGGVRGAWEMAAKATADATATASVAEADKRTTKVAAILAAAEAFLA